MQQSYTSVLEQIFQEDCPEELQIGILQALDLAYEVTRDCCRPPEFGLNEARDLRGHYLRAKFESEWGKLASGFPEVISESRPNVTNSSYHRWMKVGRIFLTASSVQARMQRPRPAQFRSDYADNGQLDLFEKPHFDDSGVYAVFIYGPTQAQAPSIGSVAFPNKNWTKYNEYIDLLLKYPGTINIPDLAETEYQEEPVSPGIRVTPEEIIQEPGTPGLRRRPAKAAGEEQS